MSENFTHTKEYQIKLLSYMLSNTEFCAIASDALKHEHFSDKALQWFFDTLTTSEIHLSPATLKESLFKAASTKHIKETDIDKYVDYYKFVCQRPLPIEEEHIRKELGKFIKTQAVKTALLQSIDKVKLEAWDEIVDDMQKAVAAGVDVLDIGYEYFGATKARALHRATVEDYEDRLGTGIPDLDHLLNGGLRRKQLGLIVGGTGRGKSVFLEWLSKIGLLFDKKVVYYTLELPTEIMADRFDSMFAQTKIHELKTYNNEVFESVNALAGRFGDRLIIKEYPADHATTNTLRAHIRQLSSIGFVPDLVIVDYLDLLKPHRTYNSSHEELDAITKSLHGLAKELNCTIWTATQTNRAGLVSETPDESSIAGAVSKLYTVDVALILAATPEEREDEELRIIVSKNRNGLTGRTVRIDTDFSRMTFYRPLKEQENAMNNTQNASQPDENGYTGLIESDDGELELD